MKQITFRAAVKKSNRALLGADFLGTANRKFEGWGSPGVEAAEHEKTRQGLNPAFDLNCHRLCFLARLFFYSPYLFTRRTSGGLFAAVVYCRAARIITDRGPPLFFLQAFSRTEGSNKAAGR